MSRRLRGPVAALALSASLVLLPPVLNNEPGSAAQLTVLARPIQSHDQFLNWVPPECEGIEVDGITRIGTSAEEEIYGTNKNDLLIGLGGNDIIHGLQGQDCLVGGNGDDQLFGDQGKDVLYGGDGDDQLFGGQGRDVLIGGAGADRLDESAEDALIGDLEDLALAAAVP